MGTSTVEFLSQRLQESTRGLGHDVRQLFSVSSLPQQPLSVRDHQEVIYNMLACFFYRTKNSTRTKRVPLIL